MISYGSVCSGIEAASMAWEPLGWEPSFFSEIDEFPRAVLKHRWPDVALRGDFTEIEGTDHGSIELLVGGTPCQSFSAIGQRGGLDDERGNLAIEFLRLARRCDSRWLVWENVPGVFSSGPDDGTRDFAVFLYYVQKFGYSACWRVLDAQYFGVPQRRRRVFLVGYLGDWRPPAAVLFEQESLFGDAGPVREVQEAIAGASEVNIAPVCQQRAIGFDSYDARTGIGINVTPTLLKSNPMAVAEGFNGQVTLCGMSPPLLKIGGKPGQGNPVAVVDGKIRRMTPIECERLQGFPDDHTLVPWKDGMAPDSPRYQALGNSMAVPVMAWLGQRIDQVEQILRKAGK